MVRPCTLDLPEFRARSEQNTAKHMALAVSFFWDSMDSPNRGRCCFWILSFGQQSAEQVRSGSWARTGYSLEKSRA